MKKIKTRLILLTLVITFLLFGVSIHLFASENDEYESIPHHYFEEINNKIPKNCRGTCTNVAMSLLLSYYDIYWNDRFVDSKYEVLNDAQGYITKEFPTYAPGLSLENDYLSEDERNSNEAYFNFALNNRHKYLQMNLVCLAKELHCYDGIADSDLIGLNFESAAQVFDKYFDDLFGNGNYYRKDGTADSTLPVNVYVMMESPSGDNRQAILDKMREEVRHNNPILYCGYIVNTRSDEDIKPEGVDKVGHSMVAYHEEDDGNILFHKGHTGTPKDTLYNTVYKFDIGILWIEINENVLPHECTEDYKYNLQGENIQVCSCVAYKKHPEHTHVDGRLVQYNSEQHIYRCTWGCEIKKDHELIHQTEGDYHSFVCECGYSYQEQYSTTYNQFDDYHIVTYECGSIYEKSHNLIYSSVSDTHHNGVCECGYGFVEEHVFKIEMILAIRTHKKSCSCGYSIQEPHIYEYEPISEDKHERVCECGYRHEQAHNLLCGQLSEIHHQLLCECGYRYEEEHDLVEQDYHTSTCDDCGYIHTTPHNSSSYQQSSDTHHLVNCGCGYVGETPHIFTCTSVSSTVHRLTCECGYTTLESHNFRQTNNPRYYSCTKCGYTRDNFGPGGNIQMGVNKEEESE